jgi:hypothetical protein
LLFHRLLHVQIQMHKKISTKMVLKSSHEILGTGTNIIGSSSGSTRSSSDQTPLHRSPATSAPQGSPAASVGDRSVSARGSGSSTPARSPSPGTHTPT